VVNLQQRDNAGTPHGMLSFTILTTEGSAVTRHLHDRMPVILEQSDFAGWLDCGTVERPNDFDAAVALFPVSPQVNGPKYDAEDCIAPLVGKVYFPSIATPR
jgi:putative SOS response-associated peptidase YedK